jgi:hypothetical protein
MRATLWYFSKICLRIFLLLPLLDLPSIPSLPTAAFLEAGAAMQLTLPETSLARRVLFFLSTEVLLPCTSIRIGNLTRASTCALI